MKPLDPKVLDPISEAPCQTLKVLKRNGSIQDFDPQKIKFSLARVSDEVEMPMTEGDIRIIEEALEHRLCDCATDGQVSFKDIHNNLIAVLRELDFNEIASAYDSSDKSHVRD